VDHYSQRYMAFGRNLIQKYSENAAELLYMLDASTLAYYVKSGVTPKDKDIIKGREYILDRSGSALVVPGEEISPFADFLMNRGNGAVQKLIGEKEEMKEPIREYVQFIKDFSSNTDESTEYVTVHGKYLENISSPEEMKTVVEEYSSPPAEDKSTTL
jgi:endonuclease IV